jgi:RimJ/RimL family protein N-acetyltransferase
MDPSRPSRDGTSIRTPRLLLRRWAPEDRVSLAELNSDPDVMRHIGGPIASAESDALVNYFDAHWDEWGYGVFAVVEIPLGGFIGFVGLNNHHRLFPQDVEIAWRLRRDSWGHGFATEGAAAVRDQAFAELALPRLIAVTTPENAASLRVMQKIGMTHWQDVSDGEQTRRVYEMKRRSESCFVNMA